MKPIQLQDICTLLSVFDMSTAVRFYCDVLGFEIENRSPTYAVEDGIEQFHWCMLKANACRLMLNTAYDEGQRPAKRPAPVEDPFNTWLFLGCPNLDEAYERLKSANVDCKPPQLVKYGFRTISFRDPDGHGITLQWPENP
jgi:glyoxylase I family protein